MHLYVCVCSVCGCILCLSSSQAARLFKPPQVRRITPAVSVISMYYMVIYVTVCVLPRSIAQLWQVDSLAGRGTVRNAISDFFFERHTKEALI